MRLNDLAIDFKYLLVNERDKKFGITVNTVGFQPIAPNTSYPSTDHPTYYYFNPENGRVLSEYQIVYISKGEGTFSSTSNKKTKVSKGQAIFLFPGEWHSYCPKKETGWNEYYIGFEGHIIDSLIENNFISKENKILDIGINDDLINLFSTAIKIANDEKKFAQQFLGGIVFHILGSMFSLAANKNHEDEETLQIIERAKVIMNENVHKDIDIKDIATKLGTSYSWFRKLFKEYTGYAPTQYFNELRLRKSKELLLESNLAIKEIAYKLNFSSIEYFLSFFKKRVNITPSEYRRLNSSVGNE